MNLNAPTNSLSISFSITVNRESLVLLSATFVSNSNFRQCNGHHLKGNAHFQHQPGVLICSKNFTIHKDETSLEGHVINHTVAGHDFENTFALENRVRCATGSRFIVLDS